MNPNSNQLIPLTIRIPTPQTLAPNFPFTIKVVRFPFQRRISPEQSSVSNSPIINYTTTTVLPEAARKTQEVPGIAEKAANEFIKTWEANRFAKVEPFRLSYNVRNGTNIGNSTIARLVRIKKLEVAIERMLQEVKVAGQEARLSAQEVNTANTALEKEIGKLETAKSSSDGEKGVVENARKVLWNVQKLLGTGLLPGMSIDDAAKKFSHHQQIDPLLTEKEFLRLYSLSFKDAFHKAVEKIYNREKEDLHKQLQNEQPQKRNSARISTADDLESPQKRTRLISNDLPLDLSLKKTSTSAMELS